MNYIKKPLFTKFIAIFIIYFVAINGNSQSKNGYVIANQNIIYIANETIHIFSITQNKVKASKILKSDTGLIKSLYNSGINQFHIQNDSVRQLARKGIQKFKTVNISFNQNKIFVGIRFKTDINDHSRMRYGLIELDTNLKVLNHYLFSASVDYLTLQPYFSLTFLSNTSLQLPLQINGVVKLCQFKIDSKNHIIRLSKEVKEIGLFKRFQLLTSERIMVEPLIYPIANSDYKYYFQYPFPIIKTDKNEWIDIYNKKSFVDSCLSSTSQNNFNLYVYNLNFIDAQRNYNQVILSTYLKDDSLFLIVTNPKNKKIDLVFYNIKEKSKSIKQLNYDFRVNDFILTADKLYIFNNETEKPVLQALHLSEILK